MNPRPGIVSLAGLLLVTSGTSWAQDDTDPAVPITVSEVSRESLPGTVPAAGTVFSRNAAQITAGLQGRLEWVAEPGDYIEAGEPVVRFDCEFIVLQREEQLSQDHLRQPREFVPHRH
jgi:multidrug efflux pump subunit AcrA (membrane-fusion protein)